MATRRDSKIKDGDGGVGAEAERQRQREGGGEGERKGDMNKKREEICLYRTMCIGR